MRIRKNAKLSPLLFSSSDGSASQTHVCHLNQSPWDVIPFAAPAPYYSNQQEVDDSFTGNASLGDSIGAVESVASMMDGSSAKMDESGMADDNETEKLVKLLDDDEDNGIGIEEGKGSIVICQKTNGKGWQCKNEAKQGQSFCDHHLTLLRSYSTTETNNNTPTLSKKGPETSSAGQRRGRPTQAAKKAAQNGSCSNPYEFYYYSGFGPLWGKRRGDRGGGGEGNKMDNGNRNRSSNTSSTRSLSLSLSCSSDFGNEELDYVEEDELEEEEEEEDEIGNGDNNGKKRMRKPVKARSLKSLM